MSFTQVDPSHAIPVTEMPLTELELRVLRFCRTGTDIYSDQYAKICRGLEALGLVEVCEPQMPERKDSGDGVWFGCIATKAGKAALREAARAKREARAAPV